MRVARQHERGLGCARPARAVGLARLVEEPELRLRGVEHRIEERGLWLPVAQVVQPEHSQMGAAKRDLPTLVHQQLGLTSFVNLPGLADNVGRAAPAQGVLVIAQHGECGKAARPGTKPGLVSGDARPVVPLVTGHHQEVGTLTLQDHQRAPRGRVRLIFVEMKVGDVRDRHAPQRGGQVRHEHRKPSDTHIVLRFRLHDGDSRGDGCHGAGGEEAAAGDRRAESGHRTISKESTVGREPEIGSEDRANRCAAAHSTWCQRTRQCTARVGASAATWVTSRVIPGSLCHNPGTNQPSIVLATGSCSST